MTPDLIALAPLIDGNRQGAVSVSNDFIYIIRVSYIAKQHTEAPLDAGTKQSDEEEARSRSRTMNRSLVVLEYLFHRHQLETIRESVFQPQQKS